MRPFIIKENIKKSILIYYMSLLNKLKKFANVPLSDKDIMNAMDGKTRIVLYRDLKKYRSVEELLKPYGNCVILYETAPNTGHWVALLKIPPNKTCPNTNLEFFDSYGKSVDTQKEYISDSFLNTSGQERDTLSELLLKSNPNYLLSYNQHKYQRFAENIKTCGRWCLLRIICANLNLAEFNRLINESAKELGITKDQFAGYATEKK
jgi:hypothetical protein